MPASVFKAAQSRLVEAYGKLPLSFEANQGQFDPKVKFATRHRGYSLFLTPTEAVLSLRTPAPVPPGQEVGKEASQPSLVRMKLTGSSSAPKILALDQQQGTVNYIIGNDPEKWRSKVPTYAKVQYENIYPGIDLVYHGNQGQLEYDFVVRPGADPKTIRLGLQSEGTLKLEAKGDLVLGETGKEIRFQKPRLYQEQDGKRKEVSGGYVLLGGRQVGFQVSAYDHNRPLMIDPVLSYSTYFGGKGFDQVSAIAVDAAGNAYVAGVTAGVGAQTGTFPSTTGSYQTLYGGGASDAFVAKLSASGTFPIYSTYLGGVKADQALAIAVDALGNAYVAGETISCGQGGFPTTTGAFQTNIDGVGCPSGSTAGIGDGFVVELSPDGSTLLYSTFLGGSGLDEPRGMALDANGNVYVAGMTFSTDFPTTAGAYQTTNHGGKDAFVTELNLGGFGQADLIYSSYLGGSGFDQANGIGVDALGNIYVTGSTDSKDFPTLNAYQSACRCASAPFAADAFVTALNPSTGLVYSTYLGGGYHDQGTAIAVDPETGDAYVTGFTLSATFPTVGGSPFQTSALGIARAFVSKIAKTGALTYSTYLGSELTTDNDTYTFGKAIAVINGNAYVAGLTNADGFPVTSPIQPTRAGFPDVFVTELNAAGSALYFSTFFGGTAHDEALAIALDPGGNAYISGVTGSADLTTLSAFQATTGGGYDGFISKIQISPITLSPTSLAFSAQTVGTTSAAQVVTLKNTGSSALAISSITLTGINSGDFNQSNNCTSVNAGSTCKINVTYKPTAAGTSSATLNVAANDSGSPPQMVSLAGTGVASSVSLSPASLSFGSLQLNTTSAAQVTALTNVGSATLNNVTISITGNDSSQFSKTTNCTSSLNAGAGCTISVTFKPTSTGDKSAAVTISDSANDSPQSVPLTGHGVNNTVSLAPNPLSFGTQALNTSATLSVTLTNSAASTDPVTVSGATVIGSNSGDFGPTNNCTSQVPVGQGCTIEVTFTPTATGTRSATLSVTDNASGSPQTVSMTGTGGKGAVSFSPTSLSFASQLVGTTSAAKTVTLTNSGSAALTIGNIAITGDFALASSTNPCPISPSTLAAGKNCAIAVTFTPTAAGSRTGAMSVSDDAPGSPQTVPLSGTATAPAVTLSPSSLTFANQLVGTASAQQTVTLKNTGTATLTINSITLSDTADFTRSTNCGSTLNTGSKCTINVKFTPKAAGTFNATVTVTDNNGGIPSSVQTVSLTGNAIAPIVTLSKTSLDFGGQSVGTTGPSQTVTLTNTGTATLTIKGIALTGTNKSDFVLSKTCGSSLAVNSTCNISVAFKPSALGSRTAAVTVTDNAPDTPQQITLSGNGT